MISGFLKSTVFPVNADTAFPTSRFTSDLNGSGSPRERSLQTISSFSAISGGTRQPTRKVEYRTPPSRLLCITSYGFKWFAS